jgi:RNA polymerase sigma factor (sigma-70 family)
MGDTQGGRTGKGAAEELILRTIAAHADSLLRTARRHSLCVDDAQDAYQRGLEIFMKHAERLDPGRAGAWLHTVVKREAKSIRRSRQKLVGSSDVDLDAHEARQLPTPEEQLLSFDMVNRSAEALQRLKPQELRALWLKAQGHSYSDISAITGWSYTKVNRCLTEGRRSFLTRYAGIESGEECARWMPVLSAMVDGEATPAQIIELRPHLRNCPGCRGRLKALQDSTEPLAALFPIPLAVAAAAPGDSAHHVMLRAYEAMAGGLHDRAVTGVTKAQAILEASSAGKVAAVAASAAAVAGGGYVSVETARPPEKVAAQTSRRPVSSQHQAPLRVDDTRIPRQRPRTSVLPKPRPKSEFESQTAPRRAIAPEFAAGVSPSHRASKSLSSGRPTPTSAAPEFASSAAAGDGGEFGP